MIRRELFLTQILSYLDKPVIKVITGIRRCGKSIILKLLVDELKNQGISEENIIYFNFESFEWAELKTAEKLYAHVRMVAEGKKRIYLLLDEIQEVEEWEKAVNSFMVDFNADIYITGSNSKLLSSELATYIAGRYVELNLYTLSFSEYLTFRQESGIKSVTDMNTEFLTFLKTGGFPVLHTSEYPLETVYKIIFDIYSSAILRDTIQRHKIRDVELLERVVRFVLDNVGSKFSAINVAKYFKSQQRKIDLNTVYNYLNALESAYIIYRIPRYDLKGKEILKTHEKFFAGDHALVYAVMGYRERIIGGVLENVIMLELKRRGYKVYTGRSDEQEIDFIAEKKEQRVYVQVAYRISDPSTLERELKPLLGIRDHHPKYIVTLDTVGEDNIEGIKLISIPFFLTTDLF